ncbi:MAG: SUF system Fe-S cluster assembly regulator [Candidatus Poribacteria bacterium]|nr:SUF system Fe-S cluster assembly regulator [Candidatus Poribacteria bacterium]
MIRITKQTDYGIFLLVQFAGRPRDYVYTARQLSDETGIPAPMVSKILKLLVGGDVLISHRGVNGGYALSRDADQISLAEIVRVLEDGVAMTECLSSPGDCKQESTCGTRANWFKVNRVIEKALEEVSLRDMTFPLPQQLIPMSVLAG